MSSECFSFHDVLGGLEIPPSYSLDRNCMEGVNQKSQTVSKCSIWTSGTTADLISECFLVV